MSKWPGKYVIGLTGNIATGKSVVRRMLEHLGAYTIDADVLAHRAIAKGAPGYKPVIETFGKFILDEQGEIDRKKLGRIVFNDPQAMAQLEAIVHPLVEQAIDVMIQRTIQRIVVIEAIKLLEGKLASACDTIWVTYAPEALQKARLMQKRGMSEAEALERIRAQSPQELKTAAANVVIHNTGSFEDTWKQVLAAWKVISPITDTSTTVKKVESGTFSVQRGRPRDSETIAALITRLSGGANPMSPNDVMAAFGEKAFLLLIFEKQPVGVAGWQVENLVARTTDLYVDPAYSVQEGIKTLIKEIESASSDLQCEVSLLFLKPQLASQEALWKELGYTKRTPESLAVQAWQEAARESQPPNTIMLFKQLRQDRVLRPI
ncbi:MAG: dephospho-CoA kinase [Anaerolineales bacterium]|nr:dephospho-CoA kinase [Anaerolineales bacterium]